MRRTPATLALVLALSPSGTAAAETCAPRAVLSGDRAAIERVGPELARLGVVLGPASARCPAVQATVELAREGGIAVAVRGSAQRSEGRVVSDPAVAAIWIDAWVRDDLEVASWLPEAPTETAAAPVPLAPPTSRDVVPAVVAPTPSTQLGFSLLYEAAGTDDGAAWRGGSASACLRVGRACLGARVRALFQSDFAVNLTTAARSDLSAFATASLPIALGRNTLAPELGLGVGRLATRRVETCTPIAMPPPNCDPTDPMCVMDVAPACPPDPSGTTPGNVYVGDELAAVTYAPRISLALRLSVPIVEHVLLDGLASYGFMPFGHGEPYAPSATTMNVAPIDQLALPGEPGAGLVLGVGVRVEGP